MSHDAAGTPEAITKARSASFDACDRVTSAIQPNTRKTIKYNNRRAILRSCRSRAWQAHETPDQTL
jgi:hypothetical protein